MKIYKKKPDEILAVEVLESNLKEIRKIDSISIEPLYVEVADEKGAIKKVFDGIAVSYLAAPQKTPKKVSAGDYLVKALGGIEKRDKARFEALYE